MTEQKAMSLAHIQQSLDSAETALLAGDLELLKYYIDGAQLLTARAQRMADTESELIGTAGDSQQD